ncbi:MAG: DUF402 domain-containing protein [Eubacteriales bacterium]|nr:DUF402 domain-containing protein [Eubacteriales bacterium]
MKKPILYRKRLIPDECVLLDKDEFIYRDDRLLITSWNTLHPKKELARGLSAFFWDKGIKISKFYDHEDRLICWYCDIITHTYDPDTDTYIMTDLLADVLIYPDHTIHVVDLDELADARSQNMISEELLLTALHRLNELLQLIYRGDFPTLCKYIEDVEH